MTRDDFLRMLDELFGLRPGTLRGQEALEGLESWDSLAVVGFMAMVDEDLGVTLSPARIAECRTVSQLVDLVGNRLEG